MPHYFTRPTDFVIPSTKTRANLVFDSDLVGGNVRVYFNYDGQPISDALTGPDAPGSPRKFDPGFFEWEFSSVGISGNRGFITGHEAWLDRAGPNAYNRIDADVSVTVSSTRIAGLLMRGQGQGTNWRIGINFATGRAFAQYMNNNTYTPIFTSGQLALGSSATLRVVALGDNWTIYVNGTQVGTFTSSLYNTQGRIGLWSSNSTTDHPTNRTIDQTARFSNFSLVASKVPAATSWALRNLDGDVLTTGLLGTNLNGYVDIPDSVLKWRGRGPYGWYRFTMHGPDRGDNKYRASYGDCTIARLPTNPMFPDNASNSIALTGAAWEPRTRNVMAMGPTRLEFNNSASNLTTANAAPMADAQILKADYVDRALSARPRHIIGHFSNGGDEVKAAQVITAAKDFVKVWEWFNEPNVFGLTGVTYKPHQELFYNAVKGADPTATVLGPNPVQFTGGSLTFIAAFLDAGGGAFVDGLSVHAYNSLAGSIATSRKAIADLKAVLDARNFTKPIWQTEQGDLATYGEIYRPKANTRGWVNRVMCAEVLGLCPIERYVSWYDMQHGFAGYPAWAMSKNGVEGVMPMLRTAVAEIGNRTLSSELDFGVAKIMYLGGVWTGGDGSKTVMVMADSPVTQPVRFRLTGASSIVTVDAFGNTATVAASGSVLSITPREFPTWLRVPSGVTLTHLADDWQFGAQITVPSPTSSSATATGLSKLADGQAQDVYAFGVDPFLDLSGKFPQVLTLPLTNATVDRVILYGAYPINEWAQLTDFDVEYTTDAGATWKPILRHPLPRTRSYQFTSDREGANCQFDSFYDGPYCWDMRIPNGPATGVDALRITIRDVSYGMWDQPEHVAAAWGGNTGYEAWWHKTMIRDVVILGPPTTRPLTTQEKRRQRRRLSFRFR